ncbi:uncharacterized protein LOC134209490 [Armigeres subalbatus]|uniref:uncharacterized protein LOC134209490 n=1 Tax=Armigeres subalbatus TaxID=124917 RepID=UPI002ED1767C
MAVAAAIHALCDISVHSKRAFTIKEKREIQTTHSLFGRGDEQKIEKGEQAYWYSDAKKSRAAATPADSHPSARASVKQHRDDRLYISWSVASPAYSLFGRGDEQKIEKGEQAYWYSDAKKSRAAATPADSHPSARASVKQHRDDRLYISWSVASPAYSLFGRGDEQKIEKGEQAYWYSDAKKSRAAATPADSHPSARASVKRQRDDRLYISWSVASAAHSLFGRGDEQKIEKDEQAYWYSDAKKSRAAAIPGGSHPSARVSVKQQRVDRLYISWSVASPAHSLFGRGDEHIEQSSSHPEEQ